MKIGEASEAIARLVRSSDDRYCRLDRQEGASVMTDPNRELDLSVETPLDDRIEQLAPLDE